MVTGDEAPPRVSRSTPKASNAKPKRTARTGAKRSHTPKPATAERGASLPRVPNPRRFDGPPSRRKSERPRGRSRRTEPRPAARRRGRPSAWDFRDRNGVGLEDRIVAIVVEFDANLEDAAECVGVGRSTARRHAWEVPEFARRVERAHAGFRVTTLGRIAAAARAGDVEASIWLLDHVCSRIDNDDRGSE